MTPLNEGDRGVLLGGAVAGQQVNLRTQLEEEKAKQECAKAYTPYQNHRARIEELIHYHNTQANNLHALLRALPADISKEAAAALYSMMQVPAAIIVERR